MSHTLTFDLGTSYFKICVFDESLHLVATQSIATPIKSPEPGHRELPTDEFERCLDGTVQHLNQQLHGLKNVTRVCFASQANSFVLLDGDNSPLFPFIIWSDLRARGLAESLEEFSRQEGFYGDTGIARLDHHFMVAKLYWLQLQTDNLVDRAHRICTMGDYFVWWLTGRFLTEAGLAGLTGLIDIHRLTYRPGALELIGLSTEQLPPIVRAGSDAGPIRTAFVDAWGLAADCRLTMGCLDQYAGAIGAGITSAGGVCETTGTVLATVRCTQHFETQPAAGVFQGPAFKPGLYYQMVFSSVSAGILERYRNGLPDRPTFATLDRLAADVSRGANGLQVNRGAIESGVGEMFSGRTTEHGRGDEVRAILETVAWELKGQVTALCGDDWPPSIRSGGGAARSQLWLDIKREIVGCDFERVDSPEPTSLGAARLARLAHGP